MFAPRIEQKDMKTIVGMFWGVMGGLFLACGVILFTQLIGTGSNLLGFTLPLASLSTDHGKSP